MKADDLLETTGILILNILDQAYKIDEDFYHYLIQPKEALYHKYGIEPILKPDKNYYTAKGLENNEPIKCLDNIKEDIYDEDGNLVISKYMLLNRDKWFSNKPKLPVSAMKVIHLGIEEYISDVTNFNNCYINYRLSEVLNEKGIEAYENDEFDKYISVYFNTIEEFIGADRCHLYFCELKNDRLLIRKTIDFRIYDWTRRMESGEWE